MRRPTRRMAWLVIAIVSAVAAVPATAAAAPPASDEYVLEIPGVSGSDTGAPPAANQARTTAGDGVQRGVVGEQDRPSTPLAAAGDLVTSIPLALLLGVLALAAIAATSRRHRIHPTAGPR